MKLTGTEVLAMLPNADVAQRDQILIGLAESGNVVLEYVSLMLGDLELSVVADAIRFGTDEDAVRLGATPAAQAQILEALELLHLTPKLADEHAVMAAQAGGLVGPFTRGPLGIQSDSESMTADAMRRHSEAIDEALDPYHEGAVSSFKHWVLTRDLWLKPGMATNYGWHMLTGGNRPAETGTLTVIQGPHEAHFASSFADYSQFITGVSRVARYKGQPVDLGEIYEGRLGDVLTSLVSHEGALPSAIPPYADITLASAESEVEESQPPTQPTPTTLGEQGPDVVAWQKWLMGCGYDLPKFGADGDHGAETQAATDAYFKDRGLARVRPITVPPPKKPDHDTDLDLSAVDLDEEVADLIAEFIQARNYRRTTARAVHRLVLHSTENPVRPGRKQARSVARWFGGPSAPMASAHFIADEAEIIQGVRIQDVAFAAPGANRDGIQIEIVGQAFKTNWRGEGEPALTNAARLCARLCSLLTIPVDVLGPDELKDPHRKGITSHASVSQAFKRSTHVDPGGPGDKRWPWDVFLSLIRCYQ